MATFSFLALNEKIKITFASGRITSLALISNMDAFTQIVLGMAVAEVCAGKEPKNKSFLYGAILGTLRDLDILIGSFLNPG